MSKQLGFRVEDQAKKNFLKFLASNETSQQEVLEDYVVQLGEIEVGKQIPYAIIDKGDGSISTRDVTGDIIEMDSIEAHEEGYNIILERHGAVDIVSAPNTDLAILEYLRRKRRPGK